MSDAVHRLRELPADELARQRREVRVLVLTGLGLNCEVETTTAFHMVGARAERVHLLDVLEGDGAPRLAPGGAQLRRQAELARRQPAEWPERNDHRSERA